MPLHARDLATWKGTMGRRDYALWGGVLFAVKYNLDRGVAMAFFDQPWLPWSYLTGRPPPNPLHGDDGALLALVLLLLSLPFVFWGVTMTLRRLRDAGMSPAPLVLFFVPFVNLLFFASLCVQPSASAVAGAKAPGWWPRFFQPENRLAAALLGIGVSVLLGAGLMIFGTIYLKNYGWGLFVGIPFMMGFFGTIFHSLARPRT